MLAASWARSSAAARVPLCLPLAVVARRLLAESLGPLEVRAVALVKRHLRAVDKMAVGQGVAA